MRRQHADEMEKRENNVWWGAYSIGEGQAAFWRVGPSSIWLWRSVSEWRIAHESGVDPTDATTIVEIPYSGDDEPWRLDAEEEGTVGARYSFQKTASKIKVSPQLADRAVVVRPEASLYISQGETVSLYISTPLWFRIDAGDPTRTLMELPLIRPSDTWFGPNTMEGETCYNTRTKARLTLADVPLRTHRAVTPIQIRNRAEDALLLERLRLPVQHLSLFRDEAGFLWTERVILEREKGNEHVSVHVGEGAPKDVAGPKRVSRPREEIKSSLILRPFAMLFHRTTEV